MTTHTTKPGILKRIGRWALVFTWCLLGLWTALALYYTAPLPTWISAIVALAIGFLFWRSIRAASFISWNSLGALGVFAAVLVWYFAFVTPNPNEDWAPYHAKKANIEITGDKIRVQNVRDFTWLSSTDFKPGYQEHVYDLNKINSMYYVVVPLRGIDGLAHVFVSFGFSDGQHVSISVEGRRMIGRPYQIIPSMFRQFQLIYAVGEERDLIGLRGSIWKNPVRFYPARTTPERMRAIFVDMMERAHSLEEHPEFYNLIFNNCMNNISRHLRRLGGRSVPSDLSLLLTGLSDRVAYRYGFIDTDIPFTEAREVFRIDDWMRTTELDETFSQRLREHLRLVVTEARKRHGLPQGD